MDEGQVKVVTTPQLRRATADALWHDLTLAMSEEVGRSLDPDGRHTLGRLESDHGNRMHNGVPYYRVRALLALNGRLEPLEKLVDVPAWHWAGWESGAAVVERLKEALLALGVTPVSEL